jgi:hypothetical protein
VRGTGGEKGWAFVTCLGLTVPLPLALFLLAESRAPAQRRLRRAQGRYPAPPRPQPSRDAGPYAVRGRAPGGTVWKLSSAPTGYGRGEVGAGPVLASRTNLCRLCPERPPVEFLATDHILGIRLASVQAPPLRLRGKGPTMGLRVGMTVQALEGLLGHEYRTCDLPESGLGYRFYHEHGIAVRLSNGKVAELIVVQVPAA